MGKRKSRLAPFFCSTTCNGLVLYISWLPCAKAQPSRQETATSVDYCPHLVLDSIHILRCFHQYRQRFSLARAFERRRFDCGIPSHHPCLQACRTAPPCCITISKLHWANNAHRHVLPRYFGFLLPEPHALHLARALRLPSHPRKHHHHHSHSEHDLAAPWSARLPARAFAEKALQRATNIPPPRKQSRHLADERRRDSRLQAHRRIV